MLTIISNSPSETEHIGELVAEKLKGTEVIAFFGGLGMGKTAFVRGLARGLNCADCVSSPTFAIVNQYTGKFLLYHFDMYRINSWDDLYSIGFFDFLDTGVLAIEWSENIEGALPENTIRIQIEKGSNEEERIFNIDGIDDI